jgi:asparagine synthase (glutamine-hydrolysing)
MCGIVALVHGGALIAPRVVECMLSTLSHRGPDAHNTVMLPGCDLGHVRLSIIDLESGSQPMQSTDGGLWIVFNGEIYNYRALRAELVQLGYVFRTHSDTEVVLAAYSTWGTNCLNRLRGMFAFVIWDAQSKELFSARDPFGEKPLYYANMPGGGLVFASEIKGIEVSGLVRLELDRESIDGYLALGYVPPDRSIWKAVSPLQAGHYLRWNEGCAEIVRYWTPPIQKLKVGLDDAAQQLRELLSQAVDRQLVADVPVGAFLSGGHDSSTIVALMRKHSSGSIKTFSVGFGRQINELEYARAVAHHYETEHHEIDLGLPDVAEMLERMVDVYDEPFADSSAIPTYLISQFARQHVKVVLGGDGGDELFGGYGWYSSLLVAEKMRPSRLRWIILRIMSRMLRDRYEKIRRHSVAYGLSARWPDTWTRTVMTETYFSASERTALWRNSPDKPRPFWPSQSSKPPVEIKGLDQAFYFDLTSYLPGDILVKVDRASMAHGLECRSPLLDRDLAEFSLSLPAALKVSEEERKIVFKEAASDWWPEVVRNRSKHGFGAPYQFWLSLPQVQSLLKEVFRSNSRLHKLFPGMDVTYQSRQASYKTWMLLVLGLWLERRGVDC